MDEPGSDRRVREKTSWQRATVLELFFDLVFVFALNRISLRLLDDFHSRGLGFKGFAETLLLFLGLWFMWQTTAALASRVHPDSLPGQFIVFSSMAGATVMAVAVPQGFERRALVFAGAWVAVRISRLLLYLLARQVRTGGSALPGLLSLAGSSVPWIAGALVNDPLLRGGFWAVALAVEFPGFVVGFRQWAGGQVAGEHLAERLQQIFLISLGEAVFVSGRAFSDSDLALLHAMGFALAFVGIVQLWRIYFYRAGLVLPAAITAARDPTRQSVAAALAHLIMISGVVLAGVGFELYIFELAGRPEPNWLVAILGGPAPVPARARSLRTAGFRPDLPITVVRPPRARRADPGGVGDSSAGRRCRLHRRAGGSRRRGRGARPQPGTRATRHAVVAEVSRHTAGRAWAIGAVTSG